MISVINRIGFEQVTNNVDYPLLDDELLISESGLTVNELSEFLDVETLTNTFDDYDAINFPTWDAGTTYNLNDSVKYNGRSYISKIDTNVNNDPSAILTAWQSVLSYELIKRRSRAVNGFISHIIKSYSLSKYQKTLFDSIAAFLPLSEPIIRSNKQGRAIGTVIELPFSNNIKATIHQIGVKYSLAEDITFYLFHTSNLSQPLDSITVTINPSDAGIFVWKDVNINFSHYSSLHDTGGKFILVAFEDNLNGEFYQYQSYPSFYFDYKSNHTKLVEIYPIEISSDNITGNIINSVGEYFEQLNAYEYMPFNFRISVESDYTQVIEDNVTQFDKALQYAIAIQVLKGVRTKATLTRVNKISEETVGFIDLEIYGNKEQGIKGLIEMYEEEVKQIHINLDQLDRIVLGNRNYLIEGNI